MEDITQMRNDIETLSKRMSLRQISLQSGVNYLTLRNIRDGKSKRVTDAVKQRFDTFKQNFDPTRFVSSDAPTGASTEAAPLTRKRGRKPGPKPGAKKAAAATKSAPAKAATKKAAAKKPGRKARTVGKKTSKQSTAKRPTEAPSKLDFASPVLGQALDREIEIAEARLDYLKSLRDIEAEFLKAIGRK